MESSVSACPAPTTWHLCWHAALGRDLVARPELVEKITDRLKHAHQQRGRSLVFYQLTPRELHVIARLFPGDSPKEVVREVATVVARWVREQEGVRGPVFADRYRAHEVSTVAELKQELRMLAWRPAMAGLCRAPVQYVNSSLRTTLGYRRALGFDSRSLLGVFDESVLEARNAIRRLLRLRPSNAEQHEWELNHGLALAIGTKGPSFGVAREVDGAAAALVAAAPSRSIDGALVLLERWVAHRLQLPKGESLSALGGSRGARARALIAGIAVRTRLCSAATVARHFGRARATLCEQMAASRLRPEDRHLLATPMSMILDELRDLTVLPARSSCSPRD